jgi:hypothetical protein
LFVEDTTVPEAAAVVVGAAALAWGAVVVVARDRGAADVVVTTTALPSVVDAADTESAVVGTAEDVVTDATTSWPCEPELHAASDRAHAVKSPTNPSLIAVHTVETVGRIGSIAPLRRAPRSPGCR